MMDDSPVEAVIANNWTADSLLKFMSFSLTEIFPILSTAVRTKHARMELPKQFLSVILASVFKDSLDHMEHFPFSSEIYVLV